MKPRALVMALLASGVTLPGVAQAQFEPIKPEDNCALMFIYAVNQVCRLLTNGSSECQPVGMVGPSPSCEQPGPKPLLQVPLAPPVIKPPASNPFANPFAAYGRPYPAPYALPYGMPYPAPYGMAPRPYAPPAGMPGFAFPAFPVPQASAPKATETPAPAASEPAKAASASVKPQPAQSVSKPPSPATEAVAIAPAAEPAAAPSPAPAPTPAPAAPAPAPVALAPTPPVAKAAEVATPVLTTTPVPVVAMAETPMAVTPAAAAPTAAPTPTPAEAAEAARRAREIEDALAHFPFDSAELTDLGRAELDAWLAQAPKGKNVRVTGHADRLGPTQYNLNLSRKRAETVRQYLVDRGIDAKRIEIIAKGELEPVVKDCKGGPDPETKACLAPNRRAHIETD